MYRPIRITSDNSKTLFRSINLSVKDCSPSPTCVKYCYARCGHPNLPSCVTKMDWVSRYLEGEDISELVDECYMSSLVRICGTGDITRKQVPNLLDLAERCPRTLFLGFSRKSHLLSELNNQLPNISFLLSVDRHTQVSLIESYPGPMVYGPRLPDDHPDRRVKVVFPCRVPGGRVMSGMPKSSLDCPACWDKSIHCSTCLICFRAAGLLSEEIPNESDSLAIDYGEPASRRFDLRGVYQQ